MRRRLLAPALVCAIVGAGVFLHDHLAGWMVDEGMAGVLLGAGTGARPPGTALALLFVGLRVLGTPLAGAALFGAAVVAASAVISGRSRSRRETRGSPAQAQPRLPTPHSEDRSCR